MSTNITNFNASIIATLLTILVTCTVEADNDCADYYSTLLQHDAVLAELAIVAVNQPLTYHLLRVDGVEYEVRVGTGGRTASVLCCEPDTEGFYSLANC